MPESAAAHACVQSVPCQHPAEYAQPPWAPCWTATGILQQPQPATAAQCQCQSECETRLAHLRCELECAAQPWQRINKLTRSRLVPRKYGGSKVWACPGPVLSRTSGAGLLRHREAAAVVEEGLQLDPLDLPLKLQLDTTTNLILKDLLEGGRVAQHQWVVHCLDLWHVQASCLLSGGMHPPTMPIPCTATVMELGYWHRHNESRPALTSRFSGWPGAGYQPKRGAATAVARKADSLLAPAALSQQSDPRPCRQGQGGSGAAAPPADAAHLSPAVLHAPAQAQVGHHAAHPAPHPLPGAC